jgi:hypothetical protein
MARRRDETTPPHDLTRAARELLGRESLRPGQYRVLSLGAVCTEGLLEATAS